MEHFTLLADDEFAAPGEDSRRQRFSIAAAREIVADLFEPRPAIYWTDFLLSLGLGGLCFALVRISPLFSVQQLVFYVLTVLLYYRVALFIHELAHLRHGKLPGFAIVWNMLGGIPFLLPSFLYQPHRDHHRAAHFGTPRDGEYLPLRHRPRWLIVASLLAGLVVPLLAVVRFLVLVPLGWLSPTMRAWTYRHASSLVIDPFYQRPAPDAKELRVIRWQEAGCFFFLLAVALGPPLLLDRWPVPFLAQAYATAVGVLTLNTLRTLGSHRWLNDDGPMPFAEQALADSVNYPHRPYLTELWGPVGTRYHALHHLFPSMPYHHLPAAHRRLMAQLPADSPYRQTIALSLTRELARLWRESGR